MRLFLVFVVAVSIAGILLPSPANSAETPKKKAKKTTTENRGITVEANSNTGKRVALVIGNGAYRHTDSMPKLANPANDADDMAAALRKFGFNVTAKKNLTREQMEEAIADFGRKSAGSDAALFYYAGHGLQVRGQNFLVPVDANISTEAQVPYKAINVNQLLEEMDSSRSRVNIVMLDACRNNPLSGKFRSGSGSSSSRGLAPPAAMPKGTVIVYATDPGNVAADGDGRNGLFTSGLLSAFKGNNLTLNGVLYSVNKQLKVVTNNQQTPYVNGPPDVLNEFSFISLSSMTNQQPSGFQPAPAKQLPGKPVVEERPAPSYKPPVAKPVTIAGIEMVNVPSGCFSVNGTQTCLDSFSIGKYEVTQGQWKRITGNNPSHFKQCADDCPVENVSWNDVQEFIRKLNSQTNKSFRLPTDVEWEYACRAGENNEYCGGNNIDDVAWYYGNSGIKTHPVGQKQANTWGIFDMSGNVWEWVHDWFGGNYPSDVKNPIGSATGSKRVIRGGDGNITASANVRFPELPSGRYRFVGFRLASPVQ